MTRFLTRLKALASGLGLLTNQETRLLSLVMGLLLLGLAVRYAHLRGEHSVPLAAGTQNAERIPLP